MGRRSLLTAEERRRLFGLPTDEQEIIRHYTLTPTDLEWLFRRHGPANKLGAALQLCLLRYPGFGLRLDEEVPEPVMRYLAAQLHVSETAYQDYGRRVQTRLDQASNLQRLLELRAFTRSDLGLALEFATAAAWATDQGRPITEAVIDGLRSNHLILPSADTIERVGLAGRARARKQAAEAILASLTADQIELIDRLVINDATLQKTPLAWLRDSPESPSASNMAAILERLDYVRAIEVDPATGTRVHEHRYRQFVREGAVAPAFLLSDYSALRRRATLTAQVSDLEVRLSDAAIDMFDKLVGSLFAKARRRREQQYQATTREVARLMRLFSGVITALSDAREQELDALSRVDESVGWWTLLQAKPQVDALAALATDDPLVMAADRYATLRRFAPAFLDHFQFKAGSGGAPLIKAIGVLRDLNRTGKREVPADAPMPFASKPWKRLVKEDGGINRRLYETAVVATLRDRLRSGDVWIEGSRAYRRFDDYLLPKPEVEGHATDLPFALDVDAYLADRAQTLDFRLTRFARLLSKGRLEGVTLVGDKLSVVPVKASTPDEVRALDRAIDDLLPRVRITDLLREVHARTGFAARFRDLRSGKTHDNPNAVLAAVLADATNLGLERMANASQGVTYAQLAWTQNWYLSEENYRAALAAIVDAHNAHPFVQHWGDGQASSSDGQFFRSGRRGGGAGAVNAKYGPEPGLRIYTHLSDQYGSFHTKVISATSAEAPHVLDGLLCHGAALESREHYTDTGGATDHVFALCHLLGYRFAPRLRDLHDRRLGIIEHAPRYKGLAPLIGRPIRVDLIRENWDEIVQLAASIKAGAVAPSVMLKKLSAYKRQNRLDLALAEVGRIERTLFTLDWLESPELRQRCQAGLNKSEARHALAQSIFVHKQGRIADRTLANQEHRASGLNLVIAAIGYWNTLYMDRAVEHLRSNGIDAPDPLLAHISPLGWSHVSLTGDYLWDLAGDREESFRPLNDPRSRLYRAA